MGILVWLSTTRAIKSNTRTNWTLKVFFAQVTFVLFAIFKIILHPRKNQLMMMMMGANRKVQEINVKLNECEPKSEIKSRSKSWYVLEVEKQKSSQIGSVLTVNLFWYFSWKRGQHGSWWKPCCCWQQFSRWGKVRTYHIFFMIITVWYYNSNRDL